MTEPYKKRAKAGFNSDKKTSNKKERIYEKEELKGLTYKDTQYFIDEPADLSIDWTDIEPIKPVKKKKPTKLEKTVKGALSNIHYALKFSQRHYEGIEGLQCSYEGDDWSAKFRKRIYNEYKEAIKLLKTVRNDDKLDNKLKARIERALILVSEQEKDRE